MSVLENEFGVGEVGAPFSERLGVEHVVVDHADVHADGRGVVVFLQALADERVGAFDAVNVVAAALYHALVHQLPERLRLGHDAKVVQELVPEAGIYQVTGGVLGTAHVQVDVTPVGVGFLAHEGLRIVRPENILIIPVRSGLRLFFLNS